MGAFNQRKWGKGSPGGKSGDKSTEEYESWECSRGCRRGSLCREGRERYLKEVLVALNAREVSWGSLLRVSRTCLPHPGAHAGAVCSGVYGHWMLNSHCLPLGTISSQLLRSCAEVYYRNADAWARIPELAWAPLAV